LIHGHNWGWDITFTARRLDACGFIVDVGKLGMIKLFLTENFDHTLLLNETDPHLATLHEMLFANIVRVPNCGMEGLAEYVYHGVTEIINKSDEYQDRGVRVLRVVCWEDSKNCATFDTNRDNFLPQA